MTNDTAGQPKWHYAFGFNPEVLCCCDDGKHRLVNHMGLVRANDLESRLAAANQKVAALGESELARSKEALHRRAQQAEARIGRLEEALRGWHDEQIAEVDVRPDRGFRYCRVCNRESTSLNDTVAHKEGCRVGTLASLLTEKGE